MNSFIEIMLALFWTGYVALMWRLLRGPANDAVESIELTQGDVSCSTQPMK